MTAAWKLFVGQTGRKVQHRVRIKGVKRLTYVLLSAFLLHLSGLRLLCLPAASPRHDCCPANQESPSPRAPTVPECCLASTARYQGSIAQTATSNDTLNAPLYVESAAVLGLLPKLVSRSPVSAPFTQPHPPPLSPLLQTCLLLI